MRVGHMKTDMTLSETFVWDLPQGRKNYLFVIFKSPSAVEVDGEQIFVENGDGMLFGPGEAQKYYPRQGNFVHDFVHFEFESNAQAQEFSSIAHRTVLHLLNPVAMSDILRLIENEKMSESADGDILSDLFRAFLRMALRSTENRASPWYCEAILRLRNEIIREPGRPWDIELMAKESSLSKSYLQMLFKKQFGISCMDAVIMARVQMAQNLLVETELSVAQIGELCGYNNTEHFIRQFKSHSSATPLKYRLSHREFG